MSNNNSGEEFQLSRTTSECPSTTSYELLIVCVNDPPPRPQRKNVNSDEKYDGMCEKCCDAGRGNIELLLAIC